MELKLRDDRAAKIQAMNCRKCGAINPVVYLAPALGTCICYNCAKSRNWLDSQGNLKQGVEL